MNGTVILVHGAWSSPADWRWVSGALPETRLLMSADPGRPRSF